MISWLSGVKLHDYGCTMKAYRRSVMSEFRLYLEMYRFIFICATLYGAKVTEIAVQHHPRLAGKSKYGFNCIFKVLLDLCVIRFLQSYLTQPIYVFGGVGFTFF
jgi:hypothetical protein